MEIFINFNCPTNLSIAICQILFIYIYFYYFFFFIDYFVVVPLCRIAHFIADLPHLFSPLEQINIDKFNVGRFTSHTKDGCPDGYMTISEQKFSVPSAATAADPMMFNDDESGNADSMDGNGIAKSRRNGNGGKWCGSAWGYNVYYSESSSINVTVKLFKFAQQQQLGSSASNNNFSFRLTYKFLKRTDAKLR